MGRGQHVTTIRWMADPQPGVAGELLPGLVRILSILRDPAHLCRQIPSEPPGTLVATDFGKRAENRDSMPRRGPRDEVQGTRVPIEGTT
jgi:hypothetical protein